MSTFRLPYVSALHAACDATIESPNESAFRTAIVYALSLHNKCTNSSSRASYAHALCSSIHGPYETPHFFSDKTSLHSTERPALETAQQETYRTAFDTTVFTSQLAADEAALMPALSPAF